MSYTLFDATLDLARIVTDVMENTFSIGASSTHAIDTAMPRTTPPDDWFNSGTIWFTTGSTLNTYKTRIITDFTSTSATFMFPALPASTAVNDGYAATTKDFPRDVLRNSVNMALSEIGGEDMYSTSLTTVVDQMTYDLPAGVYNIKAVEVASSTSSPYGFIPVDPRDWREMNDDIVMREGYQFASSGFPIRLTYNVPYTTLTNDSNVIDNLINPDLLKWTAAPHAIRWAIQRSGEDDQTLMRMMQEAQANKTRMWNRWKPYLTQQPKSLPNSIYDVGRGRADIDSKVDHVRFRA